MSETETPGALGTGTSRWARARRILVNLGGRFGSPALLFVAFVAAWIAKAHWVVAITAVLLALLLVRAIWVRRVNGLAEGEEAPPARPYMVAAAILALLAGFAGWHFAPRTAPVADTADTAPAECVVTARTAPGVVVPEWADVVRGDRLAVAVRMDDDGLYWFAWGLKAATASRDGDRLTVKGACARGGQAVEGTISLAGLTPGEVRVVPL